MKDNAQFFTGRDRIAMHVDNDDPRHWKFARTSGLPIEYFRRKPLITAERVLMVLVCAVIVWALLPWGHV